MDSAKGWPEYHEGYAAYRPSVGQSGDYLGERRKLCPYAAGSTKAAIWLEGWNDAMDDSKLQVTPTCPPGE